MRNCIQRIAAVSTTHSLSLSSMNASQDIRNESITPDTPFPHSEFNGKPQENLEGNVSGTVVTSSQNSSGLVILDSLLCIVANFRDRLSGPQLKALILNKFTKTSIHESLKLFQDTFGCNVILDNDGDDSLEESLDRLLAASDRLKTSPATFATAELGFLDPENLCSTLPPSQPSIVQTEKEDPINTTNNRILSRILTEVLNLRNYVTELKLENKKNVGDNCAPNQTSLVSCQVSPEPSKNPGGADPSIPIGCYPTPNKSTSSGPSLSSPEENAPPREKGSRLEEGSDLTSTFLPSCPPLTSPSSGGTLENAVQRLKKRTGKDEMSCNTNNNNEIEAGETPAKITADQSLEPESGEGLKASVNSKKAGPPRTLIPDQNMGVNPLAALQQEIQRQLTHSGAGGFSPPLGTFSVPGPGDSLHGAPRPPTVEQHYNSLQAQTHWYHTYMRLLENFSSGHGMNPTAGLLPNPAALPLRVNTSIGSPAGGGPSEFLPTRSPGVHSGGPGQQNSAPPTNSSGSLSHFSSGGGTDLSPGDSAASLKSPTMNSAAATNDTAMVRRELVGETKMGEGEGLEEDSPLGSESQARCSENDSASPEIGMEEDGMDIGFDDSPSPDEDQTGAMDRSSELLNDAIDKPYVCTYNNCNKRFANKFLLKKHEFIHTGERPHQCPFCGKRFNRKDNLLRHKKTHLANALQSSRRRHTLVFGVPQEGIVAHPPGAPPHSISLPTHSLVQHIAQAQAIAALSSAVTTSKE